MTHKCIHGVAPQYLKDLLSFKTVTGRTTRSTDDKTLLKTPVLKLKTFAARSFSASSPECWNPLPKHIREIEQFDQFKLKLKSYLFNK